MYNNIHNEIINTELIRSKRFKAYFLSLLSVKLGQSFEFFQKAPNLLKDKVECSGYSEDFTLFSRNLFLWFVEIVMNVP